MIEPECPRCGRTFAPDSRHTRLDTEKTPPESKSDAVGDVLDLCPECSYAFEEWLDGE